MSKVYKLDKNGDIEEMATYGNCNDDCSKRKTLVAFLEYHLSKNSNTWKYDNSRFYLEIQKTPKGNYSYTTKDGDVYYLKS